MEHIFDFVMIFLSKKYILENKKKLLQQLNCILN